MEQWLIIFIICLTALFVSWIIYLIIEKIKTDRLYEEYKKFRREQMFLGNWWFV